jgi:hypothetical protein
MCKSGHGHNNRRNADGDPPFAQLLTFDVWSRDIHLGVMWYVLIKRYVLYLLSALASLCAEDYRRVYAGGSSGGQGNGEASG